MQHEIESALEAADIAQQTWAAEVVRHRLNKIGKVASEIATHYARFLAAIDRPNSSDADKLASEVLPLADACRSTAKTGRRVLAPHSISFMQGAWWLGRVSVNVNREPWGTVLILGPSNYPLFLPGVQVIQALAAGNAAIVKPAVGGSRAMETLKQCLIACDIPADLLQILPENIEAGQIAMRCGVDKVILTGSIQTGRAVLKELAETLTPSTMELSGCDAMFILPNADLDRAVAALLYALQLNGGATCIAPRRVFVTQGTLPNFVESLSKRFHESPCRSFTVPAPAAKIALKCIEQALAQGAEVLLGELPKSKTTSNITSMQPVILRGVTPQMEIARTDIFAPVACILEVADMSAALAADRLCPYGLAASVFGTKTFAEHWAERIPAGCVVINDTIVPTADPRVSFGGYDQSGWGVTRGSSGLLEMTRPKTICTRHGKWLPHLDPQTSQDEKTLALLLQLFHASGIRARLRALREIIRQGRKTNKSETADT
jgi:acyl-CoA reductase-like NAD-dependent aldehyde dehydrogenase